MSLLKRKRMFVTKGGKLVTTSDPATCECCGGEPPPEPNCFFCNSSFPDNIQPDNKPPEECLDQGGFLTLEEAQDACGPPTPECSDDTECGTWYIDIYDGTSGDHPECDAEPDGGPFPTVSEAQAWSQANTPEQCYSTMNGAPDPDLACREGKCVPKGENPLP